jgi:hypothetical protein
LEHACVGQGFTQRHDAAIVTLLRTSGNRLLDLVGIRYDSHDLPRSDVDLWQQEITVPAQRDAVSPAFLISGTYRSGRPKSPSGRPQKLCEFASQRRVCAKRDYVG